MTMLSMSMHPSDETLSRLADQSEIERMRSRAGRHVARCERCRREIAAIEALGDAVRMMPEPALPEALRARADLLRQRQPAAVLSPAVGNDGSTQNWPRAREHRGTRSRTVVAAAALAAVVLVAALLAPAWRQHTLAAASPGEVSINPRYPRPGMTVSLSFIPSPGWKGGDTLWAWGMLDLRANPARGERVTSVAAGAPLLRERDGAYRGRLRLPNDALSGILNITSISGPAVLAQPVARIVVLTGGAKGDRPSLDALESAVYNDRYFMRSALVADAFARWAPSHPMRWLVENVSGRPRRSFDWTRFFDSEQRRFARLTEQLSGRTDLRPAEMAGMAGLAYRIEEPAIAAEWTERLLREHPDDPWALDLRAKQIHEMELRGAPTDSIAALIPSLDSLYPTSRVGRGVLYNITLIANRFADSTVRRRWELRAARAGIVSRSGFGQGPAFDDPQLRDSIAAYARELVSRDPSPTPWSGPMNLINPELPRALGYSLLASVSLARHEYRAAVELSDSARISRCVWPAQGTRALALLASGDTAAAIPTLAVYGRGPAAVDADSARRLLGSHFNPQQWQATVDSVERVRLSCRRQGR